MSKARRIVFGEHPRRTTVRIVVLAAISVVTFRWILMPVRADGDSMLPTYQSGKLNIVNRLAYLSTPPRRGDIVAIRVGRWKLVFLEQRAHTSQVWAEPFIRLRIPMMFDLRMDPYERASTDSNAYHDWLIDHAFLLVPAQAAATQFLQTFRDFPPRQRPSAFNLDEVMRRVQVQPRQ